MKEITSDLNNLEVKSLHKVEVSLHVNIEISEYKKVTLGNISTVKHKLPFYVLGI